jgi:hypothetical protein
VGAMERMDYIRDFGIDGYALLHDDQSQMNYISDLYYAKGHYFITPAEVGH